MLIDLSEPRKEEPMTPHRPRIGPRVIDLATCALMVLSTLAACETAPPDEDPTNSLTQDLRGDPARLRDLIAQQVGGLDKLEVPPDDSSIPLPTLQGDGTPITDGYRYQTTEAKRYLGKLLFHDPVRTARIDANTSVNPPIVPGEPRDLPAGTAFGGTVAAANPDVQRVITATRQTGSCGSCH